MSFIRSMFQTPSNMEYPYSFKQPVIREIRNKDNFAIFGAST